MNSIAVPDKLIRAIGILEETTRRQAEASINGLELTILQRQAAVLVEQLSLITGPVDYAHSRLKGEVLAKLDAGNLWQSHPSSPTSLDELIVKTGISKSEKSDLLAWEKSIYPYLEKELNLKPWQVWQRLNKTKRRRLTPYLRELVDPIHETHSDKVREVVERLREDARKSILGDTDTPLTVPDENRIAVQSLLEMAQDMTSRDLEEEISSEPTPEIEMNGVRHRVVTIDNETGEIVGEQVRYRVSFWATQDQINLLRRRFPDRLSLIIETGEDIQVNTAGGEKP